MKSFRWKKGRQDSGYKKMKLFESKRLKVDVYLLRFPEKSFISQHVDEVAGHEHHRFNVVLKRAKDGGKFFCSFKDPKKVNKRFVKFRPDTQPHGVVKVEKGSRWVLSIGWLIKEKKA